MCDTIKRGITVDTIKRGIMLLLCSIGDILYRWRIGARTLKFVITILNGQIEHTVHPGCGPGPTNPKLRSLIAGGNGATDFI